MKSIPFRYHVSLRITHPDIDPDEVTRALGLTPRSIERKGEPIRHTWLARLPEEVAIRYRNKHGWFHMFEPATADEPLTSCMQTAVARLQERREFIERVHHTGGRVHFTAYLYPPSGPDEPFDYALITELRALRIGFQITMYPREDYVRDETDFTDARVA
jgi:hypothetical protein